MDQEALLGMADELEAGAFDGNPNFSFRHVAQADGTIVISGDQGGLREFAASILRLLAKPYFEGVHAHFDGAAFSEIDTQPLVVTRTEVLGEQKILEER